MKYSNPKLKETTTLRVLAGQLSAADQSLRLLSKLLSEMVVLLLLQKQNSNKVKDKIRTQFQHLFISTILPPSDLDSTFLRGGAYEVNRHAI